jgi:hypothetical protein
MKQANQHHYVQYGSIYLCCHCTYRLVSKARKISEPSDTPASHGSSSRLVQASLPHTRQTTSLQLLFFHTKKNIYVSWQSIFPHQVVDALISYLPSHCPHLFFSRRATLYRSLTAYPASVKCAYQFPLRTNEFRRLCSTVAGRHFSTDECHDDKQ